jgi:hypothetical protein
MAGPAWCFAHLLTSFGLSLNTICYVVRCIIRASDPQTCATAVVYRFVSLVRGQRQRQSLDGAAFHWRLLPVAAGLLFENCFPDPLT